MDDMYVDANSISSTRAFINVKLILVTENNGL